MQWRTGSRPAMWEAPTLEWVVFSDRKTFKPLKIREIPDVLYSEVMRDVDLAVSVAHAGGVDPETSHSTVEMRKAIVECNLELFKIKNVRLEGRHAFIDGKLGQYTVHLGSGVVHQMGNAMLFVVPVHSRKTGAVSSCRLSMMIRRRRKLCPRFFYLRRIIRLRIQPFWNRFDRIFRYKPDIG